jgi:SAM-dependent methyltransferase
MSTVSWRELKFPGDIMSEHVGLSQAEPWDAVAASYMTDFFPGFERFAMQGLGLINVDAGMTLLDIASGPGTVALLALRRGLSVSAIDVSEEMLTILHHRLNAEGRIAQDIRCADAQTLPFQDATFDVCVSFFGLVYFQQRQVALAEIVRVLRPGGQVVISSWAPFHGALRLVMDELQHAIPELPVIHQGEGPLGNPGVFSAEMKAAGFSAVKIIPITALFIDATNALDFWLQVERTTASIHLLRKKLGEARWHEIRCQVIARLGDEYGSAPVLCDATALFGTGVRG